MFFPRYTKNAPSYVWPSLSTTVIVTSVPPHTFAGQTIVEADLFVKVSVTVCVGLVLFG